MATFGKAKKSDKPRAAPVVKPPDKKKPNFMMESDLIRKRGKSPMWPMSGKKLSK
jgi:hypothetical protein